MLREQREIVLLLCLVARQLDGSWSELRAWAYDALDFADAERSAARAVRLTHEQLA